MRVIAGSAKGRRLKSLKGQMSRPTTDRVKESIFSILGERVCGAEVLDLFAGTGNLGLEALSRGAENGLFVDRHHHARDIILENARMTDMSDRIRVWRRDAFHALRRLEAEKERFDLIFADPPYGEDLAERTVREVHGSAVLKENGILVIEHSSDEVLPSSLSRLRILTEKEYGLTHVHIYCRVEQEE